ncbi:MAG: YkoF family thiamine/hydroxymethylpyrimidine-binding protein [Woeseiaceae bacterium]|nr:YkoF family thiamine/hydroxymethylpyrimidine-binding protein [Woeseiaceae bacterium]
MRVAVDISLYPLDADFVPPIKDVVRRLEARAELQVESNRMSTQIRGDYDVVMRALEKEIKTTFERVPKAVFAIKILNNPLAT